MQICQDSFPMPLVEDVLIQLGKSQWLYALDLQFGFWHIKMTLKDMKKFTLITNFGLYDWNVMPFGMKNAMPTTHSLRPCMMEAFGPYMDKFLKVFVDDLNIHNMSWEEHLEHLQYV
jgi:hypothetical protein